MVIGETRLNNIKIGTSGIVLPGNKSTFPEAYRTVTRLHYYGTLFNSLEVNSSFYKIPMASTFTKWGADVPDNFRFTVKLWKGITHNKNLVYDRSDVVNFMKAANCLGSKAGCLLVQFPASISAKFLREVQTLLELLNELDSAAQWQLALEFRHVSWYQKQTYQLLEKYNASLVIHDMPNSKTPIDYTLAQLIYFRFHGPTGNYTGSYSTDFIKVYAQQIRYLQTQKKDVYVYFNNTIGGALENAQVLLQLI